MCSSYDHNKWISRQLVRVGFGLALIFTGIAHYRQAADFAMSVGNGLGPDWLVGIGTVWGYVLPFLFIVGGLSLTFNLFTKVGVWATGLSLMSIPAGLMLKSAISNISLGDTMPPAMNAFVWVLIFMYAVKGTKTTCCDGDWCDCECDADCDCGFCGVCEMCGNDPCTCTKKDTKPTMKSAPTKVAAVKAPAKKAPAKKAPAKKAAPKI